MRFIAPATSKADTARAIALQHKSIRTHRRFLRLCTIKRLLCQVGMIQTAERVRVKADRVLSDAMHCDYMAAYYLNKGDVRYVVEHDRQERLVRTPVSA